MVIHDVLNFLRRICDGIFSLLEIEDEDDNTYILQPYCNLEVRKYKREYFDEFDSLYQYVLIDMNGLVYMDICLDDIYFIEENVYHNKHLLWNTKVKKSKIYDTHDSGIDEQNIFAVTEKLNMA